MNSLKLNYVASGKSIPVVIFSFLAFASSFVNQMGVDEMLNITRVY